MLNLIKNGIIESYFFQYLPITFRFRARGIGTHTYCILISYLILFYPYPNLFYSTLFSTATYSYNMKLALDRNGKEKIRYSDSLQDVSSPGYLKLAAVTRDGLDRLVMQSELRDVYQGLEINRFDPVPGSGASETAQVNFHLQVRLFFKFIYLFI